MVTQVSSRNCCWLDGVAVAAQDLRLQLASGLLTSTAASASTGIAATPGVRYSVGSPLACTWTSGMSFTLNAGTCWVQGSASTTAGLYELVLDTTTTLTVAASDPANPRIDSVIAVVVDNGNNTSTSVFKILSGTPAGSPVAPALPSNALRLANITVGAAVSTLSAGVFTDVRVWSVMAGGILPYTNAAIGTAVGGPTGAYVDDLNTGRLRRLDASGNARAPKIGAFTPVSTTVTGSVSIASGGGVTTVGSLSITTDGLTEVELFASFEGYQPTTPAVGAAVQAYLTLDGVKVGNAADYVWQSTDNHEAGGGSVRAWVTPSAATHTVALVSSTYGGTTAFSMVNGSGEAAAHIRAMPAFN